MPAKNTYLKDLIFLTLILGSLFFIMLGERPLFVPDEGRYAEIAREMFSSGNYITPFLNHIKYFEKPILFYWLGAAAIKIGGLNLWALRSINALLGLLGCLLTYGTARALYGRFTGFLAALILGTSTLYFVMAHMVSLDLPVSVFIMATLYAFILGIAKQKKIYFYGAAIAAALAVLTKGLIGIVFPFMIIGAWLTLLNEWRLLKRIPVVTSLVLFFALAAPWHVLVQYYNPEFFHFYFIEQHFLRYATTQIGHYQPTWFFIPYFIIGFFPWIVFLPQAMAQQIPSRFRERKQCALELFFVLWAILIFLFFSFSKSKLIPYILPVFPPIAILTARYLQKASSAKSILGLKIGYIALFILSINLAWGLYISTRYAVTTDLPQAQQFLCLAASILFIGSLSSLILIYRQQAKCALTLIIVMAWLFLLTLLAAAPYLDTRSIYPLAIKLKPMLKPTDIVVTYNQYYQDLPFYLERRVSILNWRNELSYGMQHQDTTDWMINDPRFQALWNGQKTIYVIMSKDEFTQFKQHHPHPKPHVLDQTVNNVLIKN